MTTKKWIGCTTLLHLLLAKVSGVPTTMYVDVVIAGLGWGGIGTMYELQRFNEFAFSNGLPEITYVGLEAADYYGGRVKAGELISGGATNPIAELVWRLFEQPKDDSLLYTAQKWADIYFADKNGNKLNANVVKKARNAWSGAYECLQQKANEGTPDHRSMANLLDECNWSPNSLEKLFEWYEVDWELLFAPDEMSPFGNLPLWTYYLLQDKDYFVSVPGNLATVASATVEQYIGTDNALLEKEVTHINLEATGAWNVEVSATELTVKADSAVVTFSIGVLKESAENGLFGPSGLVEVTQALNDTFAFTENNYMGLYKVLYVQFSEEVYNSFMDTNTEFIFIDPEDVSKVGLCTQWQSYDRSKFEFWDGSRSFGCTLVTKDFIKLANSETGVLTNDVVKELIKSTLMKVLGRSSVVDNCVRTNNMAFFPPFLPMTEDCVFEILDGVERYPWRGAWSTFKVGWTQEAYDKVLCPLNDQGSCATAEGEAVLYLAGEAYCPVFYGFQHGAFNSGRLTATKIIHSYLTEEQQQMWDEVTDPILPPPVCAIPDGTPPIRKSKTVP